MLCKANDRDIKNTLRQKFNGFKSQGKVYGLKNKELLAVSSAGSLNPTVKVISKSLILGYMDFLLKWENTPHV